MQQTDIIIHQILVLAVLTFLGYLSGRKAYLPENTAAVLSKLVVKITAPALILTTMAGYDFSHKTLIDGLWVSFYAFVFMLSAYFLGCLASRLLNLKGSTKNVFRAHTMFGNVGYLALPLLNSILGPKGLVYGIFFVISNDILFWTLGIYIMNGYGDKSLKTRLKSFVNANTLSILAGLILVAINFQALVKSHPLVNQVYSILFDTLNPVGKTTLYLTMIFIGLTLSGIRFEGISSILKRYPTFVLTFLKLLVIPAGALFVLNLMGGHIDRFVKSIIIIELSMPCAAIVSILAAEFKSDYRLAAENIFFTTVTAMFTLPLMFYLLKVLG